MRAGEWLHERRVQWLAFRLVDDVLVDDCEPQYAWRASGTTPKLQFYRSKVLANLSASRAISSGGDERGTRAPVRADTVSLSVLFW